MKDKEKLIDEWHVIKGDTLGIKVFLEVLIDIRDVFVEIKDMIFNKLYGQ